MSNCFLVNTPEQSHKCVYVGKSVKPNKSIQTSVIYFIFWNLTCVTNYKMKYKVLYKSTNLVYNKTKSLFFNKNKIFFMILVVDKCNSKFCSDLN